MPQSQKTRKVEEVSIKEKVVFTFVHLQNAQNVAIALASAGYYVRISNSGSGYIVWIYTDRD